jgi:ATP-dependent exoDNAse (exonuclease V) beta subunit
MAEEEKRKEEAESKRIFYVATTRAKDYLVFSGWQADQQAAAKDQPGPWFSWLNETFKLTEAGDEVAYKGGKLRVLRDVPYAPGMASGRHKSWAEKFPNELASLRPLPTKAAASEGDLAQRTAHIAHSLATKLRFTPTELQEYHWCHRAYYLRYVLGLPARAVRSERIQGAHAHARLRGRLAHRALQMSAGRPGVPLEDLLAEIVREEVVTDPTGLARSVTSDRILREVAEMLARFRETPTYQEISRAKESYCEFPFLVQFGPSPAVAGASAREGGKDFYLEGQMDLLYMGKEGWEVLDYKTGEANLSYEIQLGAYCLAVERLFGEKPAGVAIFFLESDKLSRVTTTPEYLAGAQTQITGLVEAIRAGRFNPVSMEKCQCEYEWACRR